MEPSGNGLGDGGLSERLFSGGIDRRFFNAYRRLFSIHEIESEKVVQIALGGLLLSIFYGFSRWFYSHAISISSYHDNLYVCWPYFQDCGKWYFLQALPEGYSQSIFFMGLFALLAFVAYLIYQKEWTLAHALLTTIWIFKIFVIFVLTQDFASNFDYYELILLFAILFLPYKLFFARLLFVLFYFLASTLKFHDGWILGTYFTALQTGIPIFGNALAPLVTNLVIFMQVVGSWFLLSSTMLYQRIALIYFAFFHLYSGILVGYQYPVISFVMLIILFGLSTKVTHQEIPLTRRSLMGWYFVAFLFIAQFIPIAIPGDQRITLEGNYYGLFMFEANHQCVSKATIYFADGTTRDLRRESLDSTWRCDPYVIWFNYHNRCVRDSSITRIQWTFDHSIDGGPFYRIVDESNACALSFYAFSHNEWIRLPNQGAAIEGYPVKNYFQ